MKAIRLSDKQRIYDFFQDDPGLHIYEIGDLDDYYFEDTIWYGLEDNGNLCAIVLIYTGLLEPTVLALSRDPEPMRALLTEIKNRLPDKFYLHLSPGLIDRFADDFNYRHRGDNYKMILRDSFEVSQAFIPEAVRLNDDDLESLIDFFAESYPGNWFNFRMLKTGFYYGIKFDTRLAAVGGVHVFSPQYRVASLGNIAVHPDFRGQGLGRKITAVICKYLFSRVDTIGLNVRCNNKPAIAIYNQLGFEETANYDEFDLERR